MMSAKTVLTEAPACPTPAAPNNAASTTAPGAPPTDFQSLLAGVVPPIVLPTPADSAPTMPMQLPLAQLLSAKQQQTPKTAPPVTAVPVVKTADASADLIKFLTDVATLLPAPPTAPTGDAIAPAEPIGGTAETDDSAPSDDDILVDWIETMLPASVFAPQAGSPSSAIAQPSADGATVEDAAKKASDLPIPPSLLPQAGLPDAGDSKNAVTPDPSSVLAREATPIAAPNAALSFAAALTNKDANDSDKPTNDSWMSAMSDVAAKRGPDMAPVADARLSMPVHDTRWADALAHRLVLMARDGESVASLKLVPVDLGPLDIQISVRDGQATVHFGAAHAETRAVLESSLPRLRELLSGQGLQLANATVSHQSGGQNRPERSSGPAPVGAVTEETESTAAKVISTSLLDTYA